MIQSRIKTVGPFSDKPQSKWNHVGSFVFYRCVTFKVWLMLYFFSIAATRCKASPSLTLDLASLTPEQGIIINGERAGDRMGWSLSSVGDVNKDGVPDFAVSAIRADLPYHDAGRVYIIYGGLVDTVINLASLGAHQGVIINGVGNRTGTSISAAIDEISGEMSYLCIGVPGASPLNRYIAGNVYLLYPDVFGTEVDLATISAEQGILLHGANAYDKIGEVVSPIGDVDGDGVPDLLLGAERVSTSLAGGGYLLFSAALNATLDLASITTEHGVLIKASEVAEYAGKSISSAGDINADGLEDVLIGAIHADPYNRASAGRVYLIYSRFLNDTLELASLTVTQGVIINGAASGDLTGNSLAPVGDINGDEIADFLVGAYLANPSGLTEAGRAYLLYGGTLNGTIDLATLASSQGVIINGANAHDRAGYSLSSAGDTNGDGVPDFLVGANMANPLERVRAGCVYLIYGGELNRTIELGALTASDGITILGAVTGGSLGNSVAKVGDINGDGLSDYILGAPYARTPSQSTGRVYVLFGNPLHLLSDSFYTHMQVPAKIKASALSAYNRKNPAADVRYELMSIDHGQFAWTDTSKNISNHFYQSNITAGQLQIVPDNSGIAPVFEFQLTNGIYRTATYRMTAIIDQEPVLIQGIPLTIQFLGQRLPVAQGNLLLIDADNGPTDLRYNIETTSHVHFEKHLNSSISLSVFSQQDIDTGIIDMVHDGTDAALGFTFTFTDGIYTSPIQAGQVVIDLNTPENQSPQLINNRLSISEGERVTITLVSLQATDAESIASDLLFSAFDISHGQFERSDATGIAINRFTQQDIIDGLVVFQHDGSENPPSYSIVVSDGSRQTNSIPADITFSADMNDIPTFLLNEWVISQGDTLILTRDLIFASDYDNSPSDLIFQVHAIQHGDFYRDEEILPIFEYTQAEIDQGKITFQHDDSEFAPEIELAVLDRQATSPTQSVQIVFRPKPVERLVTTPGTAEKDSSVLVGVSVGLGLLFCAASTSVFLKLYRDYQAKQSRMGKENIIPRVVFGELRIKDVANFRNAKGMIFVASIQAICELYQKKHSALPDDKVYFAKQLAATIQLLCQFQTDCFGRTKIPFSEDEKESPLMLFAEDIVDKLKELISDVDASSSLNADTLKREASMIAGMTELGVFKDSYRQSFPRSPRDRRQNSLQEITKDYSVRRSRSQSQSRLKEGDRYSRRVSQRHSQRLSLHVEHTLRQSKI